VGEAQALSMLLPLFPGPGTPAEAVALEATGSRQRWTGRSAVPGLRL